MANNDDPRKEMVYLRLPSPLLERVEAHRAALQRHAASGVEVSRSAAIRNLLERGLAAPEAA